MSCGKGKILLKLMEFLFYLNFLKSQDWYLFHSELGATGGLIFLKVRLILEAEISKVARAGAFYRPTCHYILKEVNKWLGTSLC